MQSPSAEKVLIPEIQGYFCPGVSLHTAKLNEANLNDYQQQRIQTSQN